MNYRYVFNQFGLLMLILGILMMVPSGVYFLLHGDVPIRRAALLALLSVAAIGVLAGGGLWWLTRRGSNQLGRREALLLVALSWIVGAAFAALPSFLWARSSAAVATMHPFRSFVNCYFESMSGLTTTGATILTDIEAIPPSLLLWRAATQWFGGIGIVVLFVAVLPSLGVGGKKLYRVEAPGPTKEGLQPKIRETARVLLYIYVCLTAVQVIALRIAGMSWFDGVCHAFTTLATGGFSTRNASIGAYPQPAIAIITIIFMVLAGMNFGLYFQIVRRRFRNVLRDTEFRLYIVLLLAGSALVAASLLRKPIVMTSGDVLEPSTGVAIREAVFTTVSVQTTTGFGTSDFDRWPFLAHAVLIMLMFVGGCAGSTAGGIKVIRIWVAFKVMVSEIERVFRPNVIRPVRVSGGYIDADVKLGVLAYVLGIVILFTVGSGLIMLLEQTNPVADCSYTTAATASVATLCTIGPGLEGVGAVQNYGWLTWESKIVLCVLMALGRLEIFAIIVLFSPRFWKAD